LLWYWAKKIGALKDKKIIWSSELNKHDTAIIALSVDGVNYRSWEKKHPSLNKDPDFYDHKHNSCGFKYEIGGKESERGRMNYCTVLANPSQIVKVLVASSVIHSSSSTDTPPRPVENERQSSSKQKAAPTWPAKTGTR
jgi:hypothetical protein